MSKKSQGYDDNPEEYESLETSDKMLQSCK